MRTAHATALLAVLSFVPAALSQDPSTAPRSPTAPTLCATDRFVYVLRGDVLWQFDAVTLALLHSFPFPGAAAPAPHAAAEAPPPPLPLPPLRTPAQVAASTAAVMQWLAAHQDQDGRWDCDNFMKHDDAAKPLCDGPGNATHDVGVTGLAVLAMMANGSTLHAGPWQDNLKRAVRWLCEQQDANGLFGSKVSMSFIYDHAIAVWAVCEAYDLTKDEALRRAAQLGVSYLEASRNPYGVWRYQPREPDGDTSVTSWVVCALTAAKSHGLEVSSPALKTAAVWFDAVTSPDGRAGYTKCGERSSRAAGLQKRFPAEFGEAMTAAAMTGRLLLGQTPAENPILVAATNVLAQMPPRWEDGHVDAIYWFFGSLAMSQMGGQPWDTWQRALHTLLDHQQTEGNLAGSWNPVGVWDESGGRVFATALYALALRTSARHGRTR